MAANPKQVDLISVWILTLKLRKGVSCANYVSLPLAPVHFSVGYRLPVFLDLHSLGVGGRELVLDEVLREHICHLIPL